MKTIDAGSLEFLRFPGNLSMAPGGKRAAYTVASCDRKKNVYRSDLWILDQETGESRRLTSDGKVFSFLWENDHTILFAAQRAEEDKPEDGWSLRTCFYRLDLRGGEAVRAFELGFEVGQMKIAPDGRYVFTAAEDLNRPAEKDEDYALYHVVEEVPLWANGAGFVSRKRSRLYLYDPKDGSVKRVSGDLFQVSGFDLRGNDLYYYGQSYTDRIGIYDEIRYVSLADDTDRCLQPVGEFSVASLTAAENGCFALMSSMKTWGTGELADLWFFGKGEAKRMIRPADGILLGAGVIGDCSYGAMTGRVSIGASLRLVVTKGFRQSVLEISPEGDERTLSPEGLSVDSITGTGDTFLAVACEKDTLPEIWRITSGEGEKLTDLNGAFLSEYEVPAAEYIPFTDSDGVSVDGWVIRPAGYDPEKKYPGVLEIHGGPRCAYSDRFFHEMQVLAGKGYFVFFCNPRGSEGYGEEFADLRGKYGTVDYTDLMEFTDHVLTVCPQIDPSRLAATGGSYGGFMCNWIEGHTDRFAAIASQRSISNWVADFGASEIGITFDSNEMGADPWTDMEKMWEQSPLKYAKYAKTPILFIHSLCDYNCPIDQGVEMFSAMKYFGVPSRMCLFEGENHSLSRTGKPRARIRRLDEITAWFERWLGKDL